MQEGGAAQRARIGHRLRAFRRVEDELDRAVLDGVDDVRAPLRYFVDLGGGGALFLQKSRRAARRDEAESEVGEKPRRIDDARLVAVADGDEHTAGARYFRAAAELALGESDIERAIEAHDLAGRAHFRPEHSVDAGKPREGKDGFLDPDMVVHGALQIE